MMKNSNAPRPYVKSHASQQGAALVVGLVLMLVLTVLGISGMNTATLELVMAGNSQSQLDAFQAAETGIDLAVGSGSYPTSAPTVFPPTLLGDGSYSTRSIMTCASTTPVPDFAFSMGTGSGSAQAYHFDVVAVGSGPRNAAATHNQSFYIVGPGGTVGC
jgi:type IV pilus assembly protein PilX